MIVILCKQECELSYLSNKSNKIDQCELFPLHQVYRLPSHKFAARKAKGGCYFFTKRLGEVNPLCFSFPRKTDGEGVIPVQFVEHG